MKVVVIIIAILALLGGLTQLLVGVGLVGTGLTLMLTQVPPQVLEQVRYSPQTLGLMVIFAGFLSFINAVMFVAFAIGAFKFKRWAWMAGMIAYALQILIGFVMLATQNVEGNLINYVVGIIVAFVFMMLIFFSRRVFKN